MEPREDFEAFARARWLPLLRTATLLTGDAHAAEDLVQETLARAGAAPRWPNPGATDDVQLWATWAPDSAHYARAYDPSNSIVVSTPEGVPSPTS
ncbi:hypothetical protein [Pedococcus bigeumensis]|uniref:hypothetical protein n=1 Tax=Pedococcus bigeumensis TaxID=433644 RepID=UPI002FEBB099